MRLVKARAARAKRTTGSKRKRETDLQDQSLVEYIPFPMQVEALDLLDISEDEAAPVSESFHDDMEQLATYLTSQSNCENVPQLHHNRIDAVKTEPIVATEPVKPKGYVSAFNFFFREERSLQLAKKGIAEMPANALNKLIGDIWKSLSPEGRKPYDHLAAADKRRYLTELSSYNEVASVKIPSRINAPPGFNFPDLHPMPMRTLTAYSIFAQQERKFINNNKESIPSNIVANMGHYFGMRWKMMCAEERQLYKQLQQVYKETASFCYAEAF